MRTSVTSTWGKLSDQSPYVHPLICHLLDAGTVAQSIWDRHLSGCSRQWIAESFHLDVDAAGVWIAFWTSLHDIGKCTPAFQQIALGRSPAVCQSLASEGLSFGQAGRDKPHGLLGKAILEQLLADRSRTYAVDSPLAWALATILGGHHGAFHRDDQAKHLGLHIGSDGWPTQRALLVELLVEHWHVAQLPRPTEPDAQHQAVLMELAGFVSAADWIASSEEYFPYAGSEVDLDAYKGELATRARQALERAGWTGLQVPAHQANFKTVFGFQPNSMQQAATAGAQEFTRPSLMIIEAPMGLGKTEAAFSVAADALRKFRHQGVYVALPTQATSNQMFRRFLEFAPHLARNANLHLLHGQALLNADYQALRGVSSEDDGNNATVVAEEWFAGSKRGLLASFAVGTIDQGLFSILQTRHFFVRLFGLAGKVVILDEVHAYDTYTSQLLQHLLRWLGRMNCTVVLLSATLPRRKREELLAAYSGRDVAPLDGAYPRITVSSDSGAKVIPLQAGASKTILLQSIPTEPPEMARRLVEGVRGGGCAACICNTVQRAQEVFQAVKVLAEHDCAVTLLHARFPFAARQEKEVQVVRSFGKDGWRSGTRPGKAIVVATQVIEQSLDLDFDLMVTDLAPVDLILQRAGRLHRHDKVDDKPTTRPHGLEEPHLWLAASQVQAGIVPDFEASEFVYERYLLLRSYAALVLSERTGLHLPADIEPLVEQVYDDVCKWDLGVAWQSAFDDAQSEMERNRRQSVWHATSKLIPDPADEDGLLSAFNRELPDDEELAATVSGGLTRKTLPSVRVVCLHKVGARICLDGAGVMDVDLEHAPQRAQIMALMNQSVTLSRWEVVRNLRDGQNVPAAWRRSPILRHCRPLIFEDSQATIASLAIRLDTDLGIVFTSSTTQGD